MIRVARIMCRWAVSPNPTSTMKPVSPRRRYPDAHADASLHSDDLEQRVVGVSHLPEGVHLVRIGGRRPLQILRHQIPPVWLGIVEAVIHQDGRFVLGLEDQHALSEETQDPPALFEGRLGDRLDEAVVEAEPDLPHASILVEQS